MAATVFWIDPQHFATQISVSTASVFTLTAFLISLSNLKPPVDYMTKVDKVVISSMCLVFGALLITVTISRLGQTGRHELAKNYRQDHAMGLPGPDHHIFHREHPVLINLAKKTT